MTPKQSFKRAKLINIMYATMQDKLNKKQKERQLKAMAELALRNAEIRNTTYPCFLFEGLWYLHPHDDPMPYNTKGLNKILDNSLKSEAYTIMHKEDFPFLVRKSQILSFFIKALQTCKTIKCLNSVLPAVLWFPQDIATIFNIGTPMLETEIIKFTEANKKGRAAINQIFITELLMAKVD